MTKKKKRRHGRGLPGISYGQSAYGIYGLGGYYGGFMGDMTGSGTAQSGGGGAPLSADQFGGDGGGGDGGGGSV